MRATISHYKILEELGRGGMGVVYRARDQKLKREVALKVLPDKELAEHQSKLRFIQEAQSAAALKHPNIAVVYEIDEADGVTFIAMELVEGRRLRDVLREGRLEVSRAVRLGWGIAMGLAHAHRKGIIHRDLKPNNIMITDEDHAKIIDFGLAKLMEPLADTASDLIHGVPEKTETGVLVGTLSYMSPEQARGEKLDPRSDVFSFGTVLFEMLAGSSPFQRPRAVDTLAAILRDPTPSLEQSGSDCGTLGTELQRIVDRCLAKSPDERYERMDDAASDLASALRSSERLSLAYSGSSQAAPRSGRAPSRSRREDPESTQLEAPPEQRVASRRGWALAAAAAFLLAAAILGTLVTSRPDPGVSAPETPLVAVGPFENLTRDDENAWLGLGLANLVRDKLAQSSRLIAVSKPRWETIRKSFPDEESLHAAAAERGIDYIVSGELLPSPGGLVLTARLSDLRSGTDGFAYSFEDLTPEQVLARADGIASLAKQGIGVPPEETVDSFAADVAVENIGAYRAYVSGLEFFQRFEYDEAEKAFELALELEPEFTIASYRLAHLYFVTGRRELARSTMRNVGEDPELTPREELYVEAARALFDEAYPRAIEIYETLLKHFPYDVEGRQYLAEAYFLDFQDDRAIEELRRLGTQEPENEFVWSTLGTYLILSGRAEEARAPLKRYLDLAPEEPHPYTLLGDLERQLQSYEAAEEHFRVALERNPEFSLARLGLAQTLALGGRYEEARAISAGIVGDEAVEPEDRITAAFDLAHLRRAVYQFEDSLRPLEQLEPQLREEGIRVSLALVTRAMSLCELGRHEEAASLADEAIERATGPKTRYWFVRGLLELERGRLDDAAATARRIREYERPEGPSGEEIEAKAAAYLEGRVALAGGDAPAAVARLEEAVRLPGYVYALYELGLAEALRAAGDLERAEEAATRAVSFRDPSEVRLELELERGRAQLLLAEIQAQRGEAAAAASAARAFLTRWGGDPGDTGHPDLRRARELASSR